MERYETDAEVESVVRRFEQCEFALAEFNHTCHLAVGMAYLVRHDLPTALERLRDGLRRFSAHHGKMGYHETITRFWLLMLEEVRSANPGEPLWRLCNLAVATWGSPDVIYDYYDRERLMSDNARQQWVDPNKRQILALGTGPECRMPV